MSDVLPLNRKQLSEFLSSHEAIKAFEALFKYVSVTAPEVIDDVSAIIASFKTPNSQINNSNLRLEIIEQQIQRLITTNNNFAYRLETLEQQVQQKSNNDAILKRLQNLESLVGV